MVHKKNREKNSAQNSAAKKNSEQKNQEKNSAEHPSAKKN